MNLVHNFDLLKDLVTRLVKDTPFRLLVAQDAQVAFEGYSLSTTEKLKLTELACSLNNRSLAFNTPGGQVMNMAANPWG